MTSLCCIRSNRDVLIIELSWKEFILGKFIGIKGALRCMRHSQAEEFFRVFSDWIFNLQPSLHLNT